MSFFNLYNKPYNYCYYKSLKVGNSIFALGEIVTNEENIQTVITKLNLSGNIIWEKAYYFDGGTSSILNPQMVECTNGDILIMGNLQANAKANYLARISNVNGTILWEKLIKDALANIPKAMIHLGNEKYILALTDIDLNPRRDVLLKIDGNANILAKKMVVHPEGYEFTCRGITKGNSKIGMYGSYIDNSGDRPIREILIIEFDFNLTQIISKIASSLNLGIDEGNIDYLIYRNNIFYAFLNFPDAGALITRSAIDYSNNTIDTDLKKFFSGYLSNVKHNNQNIFLEHNTRDHSEITKITYDLTSVFTRSIGHQSIFFNEREKGILAQTTDSEAIILAGSGTDTNTLYGDYPIAKLNLDLDSCNTSIIDTVNLSNKYSSFDFSNAPYSLEEYSLEYYQIENPIVTNVTSTKVLICPTTEPEISCEKDKEICEMYSNLVKIMDTCLIAPESLPNDPNYNVLIRCINSYLEIIKNFIAKYPQYNFEILFNEQLHDVEHFIKEVTFNTYVTAWAALQQMAGYISGLGNCNCENTVTIDENTWLQSPDFYLQAAGSRGADSTEGNHLRWTFSGALGEKHLPKGTLAQIFVNFNKPNDFVKVHKAKYRPIIFTLDFNNPPQSINDSQHYWLYKFNNDTRIFFVYFRNATKYNQVRNTLNPFNDPIEFIRQYGNELIEIENKRELFFAADFKISQNGSRSLQLESLSVKENTVFTPKFLSFRKSYDQAHLDEKVKLFCENGRSVRLKAANCWAESIDFEFYSDFITEMAKSKDWSFMDNYALTLTDDLAKKRLDPLPNVNPVHGKWLRYNHEAYVNCENYIDKWNGPVDNAYDRNIKDIIARYVQLSDDITNPSGTESININLTNQSDPDEEPTPDELTEVNNLDILRIISTDYHIARMLGLGTLDINPTEFENTYVYLGSYTTYGDLGNGPQTVKHLSMSLPTNIYTQRLSLPVEIDSLVPGFVGVSDSADDDYINTHDGYSFDGKNRFVSIVSKNLVEYTPNPPFYENTEDIDFSTFTIPVYAGVENRKVLSGQSDDFTWDKPELSNDPDYINIDEFSESFETIPILIPDPGDSLFVDIQTQSGTYFYATYGINWFSRATAGILEKEIETNLKPYNSLLPPSNILPLLIRKEFPLMFTSQAEQERYGVLMDNTVLSDKTLIRLQFDYNSDHELITYQLPETTNDDFFVNDPNSIYPDQDEVLGDYVEIYFRNSLPKSIKGKVSQVLDESVFLSRIKTESYTLQSTGEVLNSVLPEGTTINNFIGGFFVMGDQKFIINGIENGLTGLDFIVFNQQLSDGLVDEEIPDLNVQSLITPVIEGEGLFTVVENMQNLSSWGSVNPHAFTVRIGNPDWTVHRELTKSLADSGAIEKYIEKTRGFWKDALIERVQEDFMFYPESGDPIPKHCHRGLYKITFNNFHLENHSPTVINANTVEWFNGTVRLFTESNLIGGDIYDSRKVFNVFRTQNIGTSDNLVLYINDPDFILGSDGEPSDDNDYILHSDDNIPVSVNYYPSYRVYLYHSEPHNLSEPKILPAEGEGTHYSIFALRTVDQDYTDQSGLYKSRYSVPAPMMAQEIIEAQPPQPPKGAKYATRPDFYGKSTYTFTTKYIHKPHGVLYYRSDNQALLSAIYEKETIKEIKLALEQLGGNEELYFTNRWEDLLNCSGATFTQFPPDVPVEESYAFPLPDKISFFEDINRFILDHNLRFGTNDTTINPTDFGNVELNHPLVSGNPSFMLFNFVKEALMNTFVPLTEVPVIYKFIKNASYKPINKKQKIRDKNGYVIKPPVNVDTEVTEFDMAPMMKNISTADKPNTVQFTDFTLDGTSDNVYFYAAKEMSSQLKMSNFSEVLGPIKLVNSSPAEAPKVKSTIPTLENRALGISPKINFEIAAYPKVQNIKKVNLYRTFSRIDANSVQSMDLIKVVDIDVANLASEAIWTIHDDFSDLPEIPYGDALYYRLTISRKIEYAEALYDDTTDPVVVIDYAPSQPSKIIVSTIMENYSPLSPEVKYYSEPLASSDTVLRFITLHWNETTYKGNYSLFKLNSQGNWIEIARVKADRMVKDNYHYFNINNPNSEWTEVAAIDSINGHIYIQLEMTNINNSDLTVLSGDGAKLYHHFKVIAENTAGMKSKEENILTLYNEVTWTDIGGIAVPDRSEGMIIGATFRVRDNN